MKKGLVIGGVLLACALMFMGVAQASEVDTSGRVEFKIEGSSEEGEASGVFGKGTVRIDYEVSLTSGPFKAVLIPRFDLDDVKLDWDEAYIAYDFGAATLEMHPLGIDVDLLSVGGDEGEPEIPELRGMKLEIPVEPLTLELTVNNQAVGDEVEFNYALEAEYEVNAITIEGVFGSAGESADWYGSFYGLGVEADYDPLVVGVQYGAFSPEGAGLEDGTGYYAEVEYDVVGLGLFTISATIADEALNGAGVPTAEEYAEYELEYRRTLADDVYLYLIGTSIDEGKGADSYTEYEVKIRMNL